MKLTGSVILFCASILASYSNCIAQVHPDSIVHWWKNYDQSYGNDYTLVNGIRYIQVPARAEGHPFLDGDQFSKGRIVIGEKEFEGVELKYDICNQQIILNYRDYSGSQQQIVLISNEIQEFELENRLFRLMELPEKGQRYVQVIEGDPFSCMFYWHKELVKGLSGEYYYRYLPQTRSTFLMTQGELKPFKGKRSFINSFPEEYRKEIKGYFRSRSFLFNEASDTDLQKAVQFCNELIQNGK